MRLAVIALFACAITVRADDKDELKKLEGEWQVIETVFGGTEVPPGKGAPEKATIKNGKLTGIGAEVTLATDATKKPKWLNMTFTRDGKEQTINAIYELTGDELKICMPLAPKKGEKAVFENKRPEGFDTKDKPEMMLKMTRKK
jgi:uncharacterized protein (TIGR03067 family)